MLIYADCSFQTTLKCGKTIEIWARSYRLEIKIRLETEDDFQQIREVLRLAFKRPNESVLMEKLRRNKAYLPELSLVAESDNRVIGHILFLPIDIVSENKRCETLMLAPLSVHPDFQNQGVGSKLVTEGLSAARKFGFHSVLVVGHPTYYPRFGFERASKWGIQVDSTVPDEAFMAIELAPNALLECRGRVTFPQEFYDCV